MNDPAEPVAATGNSLDIVEVIKSLDGARLSEIARELELAKSTVHSHLTTLRNRGYVTKEGEVYQLGLELFHLGQYTRNRDSRYQVAREKTVELAESLNHAIDFDVETNGRIITLFHEANESTEIGLREGKYLYVHTSATGKAILSELPDDRVEAILDRWGMPAATPHTLTDSGELFDELRETRERGYAIVDQEWLEGLRAVAVAVTLPGGEPFGALSAGGPTYQLTDDIIDADVAPVLTAAAAELEEDIVDEMVSG